MLSAQPQEHLWQKLATFPHRVVTIQFLEDGGPPRVGFVGCDSAVYRTTDGGETWREASYVQSNPTDAFIACDFTFKDSLTGWFANWDSNSPTPYYKTTDGGQSWAAQSAPTFRASAIHYNRSTGVLLLSGWRTYTHGLNSCLSTNEGTTWQVFEQAVPLNGYAFVDSIHGVATNNHSGTYQRTTDGGQTWTDVNSGANEVWQPCADTTTHTLWAASELAPWTLDYSTDNGLNFRDLTTNFHSTGTIRAGTCGMLYAQRSGDLGHSDSIQGVIYSADPARQTWSPLADRTGAYGPHAALDTRFYVKGSFIFATGIEHDIWRYIGDSTKYNGGNYARPLAASSHVNLFSNDCKPFDQPVYIRYLNDCQTADLVSASIDPPDRFHIVLNGTLPKAIAGDFPLHIEHDPLYHTPDTARLYLVYSSAGQPYYDTVLLSSTIAGSRLMPRVTLSVNGSNNTTVKSGDTVNVALTLQDAIPVEVGLDSIVIEASFDSTTLELMSGPDVFPPFAILQESHTLGTEDLVVRVQRQTLNSGTVLATLRYQALLSPNPTANYMIQSLRFNDSLFNGCVATAAVVDSEVRIAINGCGDATGRAFLRGEPLIPTLKVNTLGNTVQATLSASRDVTGTLSVYNALGVCIQSRAVALGPEAVTLHFTDFCSGVYTCRLTVASGAVATQKVAVVN